MSDLKKKIKFKLDEAVSEAGSYEGWCWDHDINKGTLSYFLRGKTDIKLSTLEKICDALGLKLDVTIDDSSHT